jgi:environmental stress-induced protein Ves
MAHSIEESDVVVHSRLRSSGLVDFQVTVRHTRFVTSSQRAAVDAELTSTIGASEHTASRLANLFVPRTEEFLS